MRSSWSRLAEASVHKGSRYKKLAGRAPGFRCCYLWRNASLPAMRTVVGITGASGAPYALRLLETLEGEIDLILSRDAEEVVRLETGREPADLAKLATRTFRNEDMAAPPASGTYLFDAMVIVPCSGTT
ncbi:MAG: hypothetical protein E6K16_07915, partial [Methanobacteriota archaeon]